MITFSKLGQYGRFGNQLWQIASTMGIANKLNVTALFPDWEFSRFFKYPIPYGSVHPHKVYLEKTTYYHDIDLDSKYDWDLEGYFQSYKYFQEVEDMIRYYFEYKTPREPKNAISMHVRRGDYVGLQQIHPLLGVEYYKEAVDYFGPTENYFIFSDDPAWCRRTFKRIFKHGHGTFTYDMGSPDILSWFEMSCCKHHVIANSSFSWWAAWIDPNPDKVIIAPKIWVNTEDHIDDRVLPTWITL